MRYRWIIIVCLVFFAQHVIAQGEACKYGRVLFYDDFGGNDPSDPSSYHGDYPNIVNYTNTNGAEMKEGMFAITRTGYTKILTLENGYKDNYWYMIGDHTHPDERRGYFLEVNGYLSQRVFYKTTIDNVDIHPGQKLFVSAYAIDVVCTSCLVDIFKHTGCNNCSMCIPHAIYLDFRLYDATTDQKLMSFRRKVESSETWTPIEHAITMYKDISSIRLEIELMDIVSCDYGNDFAIDDIKLSVCGPEYVAHDTTVCDTLLPIFWRGHYFSRAETQIDTIRDIDNVDSVCVYNTLKTTPCYRLYPLIVNKYNRQLLCDNVTLSNLFSQNTPISFQWYKDGVPIEGANADDYSELDELHGIYQLCIGMSDGTYVWSDIIEIPDTRVPSPVHVQIYDSRGLPVREDQVRHGIYLYRYEQDDHVWTEKKLIP